MENQHHLWNSPVIIIVRSIVVSTFVCLSVCLLEQIENHTAELHKICVHVAHGCGWVIV